MQRIHSKASSFLVFQTSSFLPKKQHKGRPIFQWVDALERWSEKVAKKENLLAQEVARILCMDITGGSNAHSLETIGRCVTIFKNEIKSEAELILRLKEGKFQAACFFPPK